MRDHKTHHRQIMISPTDALIELIYETTGALFHSTDQQNVSSVLECGLLCKDWLEEFQIRVPRPGGSLLTFGLDYDHGLWGYVFASFTNSGVMPKHKHFRPRPRTIAIDPEVLRKPGVKIALGRANHKRTKVYGVDWAVRSMPHEHFEEVLRGETDWDDPMRAAIYRRIHNYEILIPGGVEPHQMLLID